MIRVLPVLSAAALAAVLASAACAEPAPAAAPVAAAPPPADSAADWRPLDLANAWVIDTTKGRIVVELAPQIAPRHVERIVTLTRRGFYDGVVFHRVIDDFMAQGGDPTGTGTGGSDLPNVPAEFEFRRTKDTPFVTLTSFNGVDQGFVGTVPAGSQPAALMARTASGAVRAAALHCPGVTSMARAGDPDSANSQFFLMRQAYPSLNQQYSVWGRAVVGLDVIRALKVGVPAADPDRIVRARMAADMPADEQPKIMVQRVDGPAFQAMVAPLAAAEAPLDLCALPIAARVLP